MSIRNWLKQLNQHKFFAKFAALILFLALSSCTDQGCIEADDFGEYETQTLEIPANASSENCIYDASKELTDADQGAGIKTCFTSGTATVIDEENETYTSDPSGTGCTGFEDAEIRNLCVNNCVQSCYANAGGSSSSAEPSWISTDARSTSGGNFGVTIRPGSQIILRTIGTVKLGDSLEYDPIYVRGSEALPHTKKDNWTDRFIDVRAGQTYDLKFSGSWKDSVGGTAIGGGTSSTITSAAYNGSRRFVAYLIPHPSNYDFDTTKSTESAGSKVVPLVPAPIAWTCEYSGAGVDDASYKQSNCKNKSTGYTSNGYTNVTESLAQSVFPVSSAFQTTILTTYGGVIRWTGDGLMPDGGSVNTFNPFGSISCNNAGSCAGAENVAPNQGRMLGNASSGNIQITNTYPDAYKVSFKSLAAGACSVNLVGSVTSGTTAVQSHPIIPVNSSSWSTTHITLGAGETLTINSFSDTYGSGTNCGYAIAVRFNKYHDLTINRSGWVSFTNLHGTGSCTIRGRVVNPTGWKADYNASYTKDYYEYGDFTTAGQDPLDGLTVNSTGSGNPVWSNRVYVRKGQVIRFSPESWNNTSSGWKADTGLDGNMNNSTVTRECGIGMAMRIEPRPALVCRGTATDMIANTACTPEYNDSGTLIGCQAISSRCTDEDDTNYYCPTAECQKDVQGCTDGVSPSYAKTGCTLSSSVNNSSECTYYGTITADTCGRCSDDKRAQALLAAKVSMSNLAQCYDLENYTGKVSNIPSTTGFTSTELGNPIFAKGAVKLGTFNGEYGNFESFIATSDRDNLPSGTGNTIYQLRTPITFSKAGRLVFFMLDGDLKGAESSYADNPTDTTYTGNNGFKVIASSMLEFTNGEWLQARLCKETSDDSVVCKNTNPTAISSQPPIIEITAPTSTTTKGSPPVSTSPYKFDSYGNLLRTLAPSISGSWVDCDLEDHGLQTAAGVNFYCHNAYYYTSDASDSDKSSKDSSIKKLRLTFKIMDPETPDCSTTNPSSTNGSTFDGVLQTNPYYESNVSSNAGKVCSASEVPTESPPSGKTKCTKERYCGNKYANNGGQYYVTVKVKSPLNGTVSSIIGSVITPVIEVMDGKKDGSTVGQAERIYKLLIADSRYKAIVTMMLVVMYTFYGFTYLLGISDLNSSEIINRVIKIGLIYLFIGEQGWDWFNKFFVKFFKNGTDYLAFMMASSFDDSPEMAQAIASQDYYDKSVLFSSVDRVFSMFFSLAVQKKISALLFASLFGWAYLFIIYSAFMLYVYAVANSVLLYLTAQVFISILFTLGPIFMILTLFNQTKGMFDNWLNQLIGFSLQQIFLLTTLAFFNMLMYEVIKMSLGYKICWDEVWTINIITRITLMSFWTIASLPPRTNAQSDVGNIGNPEGIPSLFSILFIWVIASLMKKFIEFMTNLAASIGGSLQASAVGSGLAKAAAGLQGHISKKMSAAWQATGGKAMQKLDKALFDSGKLADDERAKKKAQNTKDQANKSAMNSAANKAVSDYKKKNGAALANMTKDEQRQALNKVKNDAIAKKGEDLGLSEKEVKRLKDDKGLKYTGDNVFGAAAAAAKQSMSGGGLSKSLNDRDVSTKFSNSEKNAAMKNMNADERKQFIDAAMKGNIEVSRSASGIAKDSAASAGKAVANAVTNPKQAAKDAASAVKGAVKGGLKSAAKSAADATGGAIETDSRKEAREQLEAAGLINKRAAGTEMFRSDSEKKMIRDKEKSNAQAKKDSGIKQSASRAIDEMKKQDRYQSAKEALGPDASIKDKLKLEMNEAARSLNPMSESNAKLSSDTKDDMKKASTESVKENLAKAEESKKDLVGARNDALKEMDKIENADGGKFKEQQKEIKELQKVVDADNTSAAQRMISPEAREKHAKAEEAKKQIDEIRNDQSFQENSEKFQKANVAANQLEDQIKATDNTIKDMQGKGAAISNVGAMRDKASAAVKAGKKKPDAAKGEKAATDKVKDKIAKSHEDAEKKEEAVKGVVEDLDAAIDEQQERVDELEKADRGSYVDRAVGRTSEEQNKAQKEFTNAGKQLQKLKEQRQGVQKEADKAAKKAAASTKEGGSEKDFQRAEEVYQQAQYTAEHSEKGSEDEMRARETMEAFDNISDNDELKQFNKDFGEGGTAEERREADLDSAVSSATTVDDFEKINQKFGGKDKASGKPE